MRLQLPNDIYIFLSNRAKEKNITVSELIRQIIEQYVNKNSIKECI